MERVIQEILSNMVTDGFVEGTEQYEICKRSLQFQDFSYKRSEELQEHKTVDCSTLTSQSHWEGALIGIPFVADNQRRATSGQNIVSTDDMIPGDVLVKYPSLDASPDKTWNHVGLYLGRDADGGQWLIESTSKTGVRLSKVKTFNPQGGIKRFTLTNQVFDVDATKGAMTLAPLVPKFGRLGVRQYHTTGEYRSVHKGLDIYVEARTPVFATMSGTISSVYDEVEDSSGVEIRGQGLVVCSRMIDRASVRENSEIQAGDLIGYVAPPSKKSQVKYSELKNNATHLHLEVQVTDRSKHEFAQGIAVEVNGKKYVNHLYLSKVGLLSFPFRV